MMRIEANDGTNLRLTADPPNDQRPLDVVVVAGADPVELEFISPYCTVRGTVRRRIES